MQRRGNSGAGGAGQREDDGELAHGWLLNGGWGQGWGNDDGCPKRELDAATKPTGIAFDDDVAKVHIDICTRKPVVAVDGPNGVKRRQVNVILKEDENDGRVNWKLLLITS